MFAKGVWLVLLVVWLKLQSIMTLSLSELPPQAMIVTQNSFFQGFVRGNETLIVAETTKATQTMAVSKAMSLHNVSIDPAELVNQVLFTACDTALAVFLTSLRSLFVSRFSFTLVGFADFDEVCELRELSPLGSIRNTTLLSLASTLAIVQLQPGSKSCHCNLYLPSWNSCDGGQVVDALPCECYPQANVPTTILGYNQLIISKVRSTIYKYHLPTRILQPLGMLANDESMLTAVLTPSHFVVHQACSTTTASCAAIAIIPFVTQHNDSWPSGGQSLANAQLPLARVHAIATCGNSIRYLVFAVSYFNGSNPVLELHVLKQSVMAPTYTMMAMIALKSPSNSYNQVELACSATILHFLAPNSTGQWERQDFILENQSWQPNPFGPSFLQLSRPSTTTSTIPASSSARSTATTTLTPSTIPSISSTASFITSTRSSRITKLNTRPQLALWLGLSLGAAALCSLLTAYCCWQRQLRATRIAYQLNSSVSNCLTLNLCPYMHGCAGI
jgi:hypothetical protein